MPTGRIKKSFEIIGKSFSILLEDKELLLFPIFSLISGLLIIGGGVFLLYNSSCFLQNFTDNKNIGPLTIIWICLALFFFYFVIYFLGVFFNATVIKCIYITLKGGSPRFIDGIKSAFENIVSIFLWSLIAATVGTILHVIHEKLKRHGMIIGYIGQLAWSYAVLFVIPILVIEKEGVVLCVISF